MLQEKAKFNRLLMDFILGKLDDNQELAEKDFWTRRVR
jgi:hypothetical protein